MSFDTTLYLLNVSRRILGAADYLTGLNGYGSLRSRQISISKSAAVLVGFFVFHSFPNVLLLTRSGREKYSNYGSFHSSSVATKLIEMFLLGAGVIHCTMALHKQASFGPKKSMLISGVFILGLLMSHLIDFRFSSSKTSLDQAVLSTLNSRLRKKVAYSVFVLAVTIHAWRGATPAWLFRLGFRGKEEISFFHRACRSLIVLSAVLYHIPLVLGVDADERTKRERPS